MRPQVDTGLTRVVRGAGRRVAGRAGKRSMQVTAKTTITNRCVNCFDVLVIVLLKFKFT